MAFKICTVGCGQLASEYHGPSYAQYSVKHPGVEFVACCDLDEVKSAKFRDRFGFVRYYTDMEKMLNTEQPAAVCLVVPEHVTCNLCCKIMEMGYPVMMEKPPGRNIEELDRMIAIADAHNIPTQVAFNRRHAPLVRKLRDLLNGKFDADQIHHINYDFTRVDRRDADFSATAIHGIDTVRYLTASDFKHIRFHYQEFPNLGPTVANIFMDCVMKSGATAKLNFNPVAGVIVERATVHAFNNTFFLNIPMWDAFDSPGQLQHLEKDKLVLTISGSDLSNHKDKFERGGFYAENVSFFEDIRQGRCPKDNLKTTRQSVEVAEYLRNRKTEYFD